MINMAYGKRGCLKRAPSFFICSFLFVRPKRNEPKKKGAGNDNFSLFWQNAFGVTLPKKRVKFAPFPVCHRTFRSKLLLIIDVKC